MHLPAWSDKLALRGYVPDLISIMGEQRWRKRMDLLTQEGQRSVGLERVVSDYHWLECVLSTELSQRDNYTAPKADPENRAALAQSFRALRFARNVVEFWKASNEAGKQHLRGRLLDGLKSPNGFLPLAQELEFASFGVASGCLTSLPDAMGTGRQDASFEGCGTRWFAECKFLSADAGRKITRRDFYRLFALVEADLVKTQVRDQSAAAIVVSVTDRLSASAHLHGELVPAIKALCSDTTKIVTGADFNVFTDNLSGIVSVFGTAKFYEDLRSRFGASSHACGFLNANGRVLILIVRSEKEDDSSKPILDALSDAAKQLPAGGAGVISLHLQGVSTVDLRKQYLQEKLLLLTNYFFYNRVQRNVASVHVATAGELLVPDDLETYYALSFPNPMSLEDPETILFPHLERGVRVRLVQRSWAANNN